MVESENDSAKRPGGRWSWRRVRTLVVVNCLLLGLLLFSAELAVRVRSEGSFGAGWSSLFGGAVRLSRGGDSDWLELHEALGYRLNTTHDSVSSLGIRHAELDTERAPDSLRVVVLGDSVSWEQDGWIRHLRDDLVARVGGGREVEVVNAAIPGYTTHQERLLFESGLDDARPDLVLLQYCLNDNHEFLHELTDGAWLVRRDAKQVLVPEGGGFAGWLSKRSYLVFELRKHLYLRREKQAGFYPWDASPDFAPAWEESTWPRQRAELEKLRDAAFSSGARFAVVVVPYELQIAAKYLERDRDYTLAPQRFLSAICEELSVPLLDAQPAFLARRDERLYKAGDPVHLTPLGHELLSERVLEFLDAEGLVR